MRWRKLGLVYTPPGDQWWARTHAFIPTADVLGNTIRIYFAGLDERQHGRVGYITVDASAPTTIVDVGAEPVLDVGVLGAFDDAGVNASCIVNHGGRKRLYYIGWQRTLGVPYMLFSGLAESTDGITPFVRHQRVPVLDRTPEEPFSRSAPCVLRDGDGWRAWYWTCEHWSVDGARVHYNNVLASAWSADGVTWTTDQLPVLRPPSPDDYSIGRPWVVRDADRFRMWYSIRSRTEPYRIGYAESADGVRWEPLDGSAGVGRSAEGWDAEMVCFPCVVDAAGTRLMFYNGNGHGRTGFGVAVLERE